MHGEEWNGKRAELLFEVVLRFILHDMWNTAHQPKGTQSY